MSRWRTCNQMSITSFFAVASASRGGSVKVGVTGVTGGTGVTNVTSVTSGTGGTGNIRVGAEG